MVVAGMVRGGFIDIVFWPPTNSDFLYGYVEFPPGTPPEVTRDALQETLNGIERTAERYETTDGSPMIQTAFTRVFSFAPHRGRIVVELVEASKRTVHSQDISVAWQEEVGLIPGAVDQKFLEDGIGMDGPPIEIWLQAKELDVAVAAAGELKEKLNTYDGVYQISDDFREGKTEVQVRLKPVAHTMGLTLVDVARQIQAGYYGDEPMRLQRGRDDMRVRVRFPRAERSTLAELHGLRIRTREGDEVPLRTVADVTLAKGYSSIKGTNGLRRVAVYADVDAKRANPTEVIEDLKANFLDDLIARYGNLYWEVEGVEASNQETLAGLKRGFIVAALGIFVIMATIFRSYIQPMLILFIIPFGIMGAFVGHWLIGIPVTILSLFGIVALAGVVVNDNIVLVECCNNLIARGTPFYEALCQGGVRRFRAIFLTSASTCAGLSPIILERDLEAQVVIPMAVSIAAGVAFATGITLLLIPACFALLNDVRRGAHRFVKGTWPTPEEVEPAYTRGRMASAVGSSPAPESSGQISETVLD
jgi:multidrug efflux pump subunit AcrB